MSEGGISLISRSSDLRTRFVVAALAVLGAGLVAVLGPGWLNNPDLAHGLFAPVASFLLLREATLRGVRRHLSPSLAHGIAGAALAVGLLGLVAGGLYATALEWSHALVGFVLAGSYACLLLAGVAALSSESTKLTSFNWSACAAAGVWILSAPIPPGTYTRITLTLQLWVTENVLGSLHLLGIAARQHGNIIELARTTVGVEEACSGVRSLVSCIFAGVFLSGTLVRRPLHRALLIGVAAPLALGMNFVRSLLLTLLANSGISIEGA
jgi:hypothetical protein